MLPTFPYVGDIIAARSMLRAYAMTRLYRPALPGTEAPVLVLPRRPSYLSVFAPSRGTIYACVVHIWGGPMCDERRVLVVEDAAPIRDLLHGVLTSSSLSERTKFRVIWRSRACRMVAESPHAAHRGPEQQQFSRKEASNRWQRPFRLSLRQTASGYLVTLAHHGAHGLQLITTAPPCVILLDLDMPVMDEQDFVRTYRQTPPPHAYIILMTTSRDGVHHAAALQVAGHLRKSFELDDLLDMVDHHIRAHPATALSG